MKKTTLAIVPAAILAFSLSSATASAGDCKDSSSYAKSLMEAADQVCSKVGDKYQACNKLGTREETIKYWLNWWNNMVGGTWAKIGPRHLLFNTTDSGTIINPGTRVWTSMNPSAGAATVRVTHLDGKASMKFSYCALDATGALEFLGENTVGASSPADRVFSAAQITGKFVVVKMDGDGGMLKSYKYRISLTGTQM